MEGQKKSSQDVSSNNRDTDSKEEEKKEEKKEKEEGRREKETKKGVQKMISLKLSNEEHKCESGLWGQSSSTELRSSVNKWLERCVN